MGRDNVKEYLKNNPDFAAEIERQVRENADKLLPGAARRAAAKPKAVEEAPVAPAPGRGGCGPHRGRRKGDQAPRAALPTSTSRLKTDGFHLPHHRG